MYVWLFGENISTSFSSHWTRLQPIRFFADPPLKLLVSSFESIMSEVYILSFWNMRLFLCRYASGSFVFFTLHLSSIFFSSIPFNYVRWELSFLNQQLQFSFSVLGNLLSFKFGTIITNFFIYFATISHPLHCHTHRYEGTRRNKRKDISYSKEKNY